MKKSVLLLFCCTLLITNVWAAHEPSGAIAWLFSANDQLDMLRFSIIGVLLVFGFVPVLQGLPFRILLLATALFGLIYFLGNEGLVVYRLSSHVRLLPLDTFTLAESFIVATILSLTRPEYEWDTLIAAPDMAVAPPPSPFDYPWSTA